MSGVRIRFYFDRETGEPHIHNHGIFEYEVEEAFLSGRGQDRASREGTRMLRVRPRRGGTCGSSTPRTLSPTVSS